MRKGAALLISTLVLGVLLLSFAIVGIQGFIVETGALTSLMHKKNSEALASSCIEIALFRLASDENYAGNETIALGSESCTIRPIRLEGMDRIIETEAVFANHATRLRILVTGQPPMTILGWEEAGSF